MAQIERDAEERAKDRRERRKRSEEFKMKANRAFRAKEFEKALDLYNKVRCAVLYESEYCRDIFKATGVYHPVRCMSIVVSRFKPEFYVRICLTKHIGEISAHFMCSSIQVQKQRNLKIL